MATMSTGTRSQKAGGAKACNQQVSGERQGTVPDAQTPFDDVINSVDTSKSITVEVLVAPFKAQDIATRTYFENILKEKNEVIKDLENKVEKLEIRVDDLEQYSRRNSIRLSGVGESIIENPIKMLEEKLDVEIDHHRDIDRYHRVGKTNPGRKPRDILIKFANYHTKAAVIRSRYKLKGTGYFINEDLTKLRSKLLFECRNLKKQSTLKDAWTRDGNIYIKLNDDTTKRITSPEDLRDIS